MESSDQKVWVKYGTGRAVKVSVSRECDVNGLIEAIKGKLSVTLQDYDVSQIYLHGPEEGRKEGGEGTGSEGETAYRPSRLVASILTEGVGFDDENPILIRTTAQQATAITAIASSGTVALGEKLVAEIVDRLKSVLPSNRGEYDVSSPQMSHAELADFHLKSLRKKMPTFAPPMSEGLPICATEKLAALKADRKAAAENRSEKVSSAIKNESYLCWQMTPYLSAIFEDTGVVVNSEEYCWVVTYSKEERYQMKPDFFVTKSGLQKRRESSGNDFVKSLRPLDFMFGEMPWGVRDCLRALVEFKNTLVPADFGKMILYLQHLCRDSAGCMYYGMLCDDTDIILVSCRDFEVCTRYDLKWDSPGSLQFIRDFVAPRNDWMELLDLSLSTLDVQLSGHDAFLGAGGNGRVFIVQSAASSARSALKIVLTNNDDSRANSVFSEHHNLQRFKDKSLPVVSVVGGACAVYREYDLLGVCYLIEEVGSAVTVESAEDLVAVFELLFALHKQGEFHGDARLPNIIRVDRGLLWIDLFAPHFGLSTRGRDQSAFFYTDVDVLTRSIEKLVGVCRVKTQFEEAATAYASNPTATQRQRYLLDVLIGMFF